MPATDISICNGALTLIGANRINSFLEASEEASICNDRFRHVRDAVLQIFPWACCIYRRVLTQSAVKPVYNYRYKYILPESPSCISVLEVFETTDWVIEEGYLVTNAAMVSITYVGANYDSTSYPAYLAELMSARLASEIAYKLTGQVDTVNIATRAYAYKLREAIELDGRQGNMPNVVDDVYTDAWLLKRGI